MFPKKPNKFILSFVTFCFLMLETAAPVLAQVSQTNRFGFFLVPNNKADIPKVDAIRGLMTGIAARLQQKGVKIRWGAVSSKPTNIDKVFALVKQGKELLAKADGKAALKVYTQAERLLRTCLVNADRSLIALVYKGLGVSFMMNGQMDMGQQMLQRSLIVYPVQRSKEYAFTLDISNNLALSKQQIENADQGSLTVKSNVPGAMIFVDREFKGLAPMTIDNLKAVEHLVEVIAPGYYESFNWMMVVPRMSVKMHARLKKAPVYKTYTGFMKTLAGLVNNSKAAKSVIASLSDMFNLTNVFFLRMSVLNSKLNINGLYYANGKISKISRSLTFDDQLLGGLGRMVSDFSDFKVPETLAELQPLDAPPAASAGVEEEDIQLGGDDTIINPNSPIFASKIKKTHKKGITEKWWFWTIIGAAVVGGFTAGFLLVRGKGSKGPSGTLDINLHGVQ